MALAVVDAAPPRPAGVKVVFTLRPEDYTLLEALSASRTCTPNVLVRQFVEAMLADWRQAARDRAARRRALGGVDEPGVRLSGMPE